MPHEIPTLVPTHLSKEERSRLLNKDKRLALAGGGAYARACAEAKKNGTLKEFLGTVAKELS